MKQILLNIPDDKYPAFMEILNSLDFVKMHNENDVYISDEEKELVLNRIKNSNPADGKRWEDIKDSFKFD
jgi:hypothetical protein